MRALHADALSVLRNWAAPNPDQEALRQRFLELLAGGERALSREGGPEHVTTSAVVFDPQGRRTLLTLHGKSRFWVHLGGHCERGDGTLAEAALREAYEESGIPGLRLLPQPVDLDRHELSSAFGRCRAHWDVRYVAVAPAGAVERISDESLDLRWFDCDDLPDGIPDDVPRLVRAGQAALAAAR